jgi:hypothetical protein
MASSWGDSWGTSWGDSWGIQGVPADVSQNPVEIHFVMSSSYQNSSPPNNLALYPRRIEWDNPASAGHVVTIKDGSGAVVFQATAKSAGDSQYFVQRAPVRWNDFIVSRIDSGTLYLYFKT